MILNNLFLLLQDATEAAGSAVANALDGESQAAAAEAAQGPADPMGGYGQIIFIVVLIAIFYFLLIRPQRKQQQKMQEERNAMAIGDNIVTNSGLYGKIEGINKVADKKGNTVVESFIIKLKPDYTVRVQINKDAVYKDFNDVAATEGNK